jgi:excisionase family DNA binding protein
MTPAEVASAFGVDTQTVTRWARSGKLESVRTLGGHRRFAARDVEELLRRNEGHPSPPRQRD